jgi:general secretion pathway protein D
MRAVAEQEMSENAAAVTRQPAPAQTAGVSFTLGPQSGPVAAGTTFKVPVVLNGGTDIASVPLQIQYDPAKLSLVNVDSGDFLSRDGKPVGLVHRDDGPGTIVIGVSRPPGASGVSGTGVVCVLSFQAKTAGESAIVITHPGAVTSAQKQLPAQGARVSIQVR